MIFQPTNIYPSSLGGLGDGVIDATEDLTVSWQINGNSPMTAYTITIYKNDTASTQVYTTGMVTLDTPFYGVDYNGNVQMFTATIEASELVDKVTNGNDYKMIIRQYWSTTDYVEQTSASAFSAKAKPTLSIDTITSPVTSRIISIKATYSQAQGDTITWIRWRFASKDNAVYSILDDTHNIYGTAQLQYDYDGLFSGSTYAVKCEVQTSSGVDVTTDWYDFTVSYESEPMTGALVVTCDKTNNGIKVEFPEIVNIAADDNFINKVGELTESSSWSGVASNDNEPISIAISENGTVNYSKDGITWTASSNKLTTPIGTSHWSSAHGNGTFVALPYHTTTDSYSYAYSTDNGSTWTNSTIDNFIAYDVIYADDRFIAVGKQVANGLKGRAESIDGITWTLYDMPTDNLWGSVVFDNSNMLASARDVDYDNVLDLTSNIEFTWIQSTMPSKINWTSVTYGNGKFVAVSVGSSTVAYSTDGITWNTSSLPSSDRWSSVTYGNGKFVAVAGYGMYSSNAAAYSVDGITWTATTLPSNSIWVSVTYGNGKFVAIAYRSDAVAYSTDGVTWSASSSDLHRWSSVTYGNGKFVAVAGDTSYTTNVASYSTDGITWTAATLPSDEAWTSVTYGNGNFVAVASDTNVCAYSKDGITWTASTMPSSSNWSSIASCNGKFVAVASGDESAYSNDGITWISLSMTASESWDSVIYGNGKFVAVAYFSDACAYLPLFNSYTLPLYASDLSYGNNTYVAVQEVASSNNEAGTVMYSTDLSNWTSVGSVTNGKTAVGIEYINGYFVVASTDGRYAYSKDGITWEYKTLQDSSIVVSDIGWFNIDDVLFLPSQSNTTTKLLLSDGTTIADSYAVLQNGAELIYNTVGDEAMSFEGDNAVVWRGKCNASYDIFSITYDTDGDKYKFARVDNKIVVIDTASGDTVSIEITNHAYYMTIMYSKPYLYVSTIDSNNLNLLIYQLSVSDFIDLSLIESMSIYKTLNVGSCDFLYVSDGTLDEETVDKLLTDYTYHPSDLQRYFLADYNSGLDGGASESGDIESVALYRLANRDESMLHIYDAQIGESSIIDLAPTSNNEYQYYGVAVIGGKYSSSTISSNSVTPHFGNWCLYSCTLDNDGVYHPESVFLFNGNLTSVEVSNNSQPNVLNNFTRYPLIQQSPWNYKSGKLQGLIGAIVDGVYSDTISLRDAIYDLSTTDNTLFLKNRKGDLMMVKLSDAIGMTTDDVSVGQYQTMSLPWVEVGGTDEVSIILN